MTYIDLPELQFQLLQAQKEQEEEQRYEQLVRDRTASIAKKDKEEALEKHTNDTDIPTKTSSYFKSC